MKKELENEVKLKIDRNEYKRILSICDELVVSNHIQINHYFDTSNYDLFKKHSVLRVREIDNSFTLTLKSQISSGSFVERHIKIEGLSSWSSRLKELFSANEFDSIDLNRISSLGTLTTTRTKIAYKDVVIELDKSEYNGLVDYEIEVEASTVEKASMSLEEFATNYRVLKSDKPNVSKYQRFISSLGIKK